MNFLIVEYKRLCTKLKCKRGTWGLIGAAGITTAGGLISSFGSKKQSLPELPPFQKDPLVENSENSIFNFGSDVLKGILPSSYQNLLQFDSPQFEGVLKNSNRDVESAGLETAARAGNARSGAAQAGISRAVSDNTTNLRYNDYMNTLANQKALLGTGLDAEQIGGNMALQNQGQQNSYTLGGYGAMLGAIPKMTQLAQEGQAGTGSALGQGLGSLLSSVPYIASAFGGSKGGTPSTGGVSSSITGSLGAANKTPGGLNIDEIIKQISENSGSSTALVGALS